MPILDKPAIVLWASLYLAAVILVGFWAARRTQSAKDFFIAGQRIGLVVTGLATMSAAFSGFVFIGGPGLTYRMGVASLFICIPVSFTAGLLCWLVAKRLRLLAGVREVFTIPDALYYRFQCRRTSGLAAVAIVLGTVAYLGAQLLAMGRLIEAIFGTRELFGHWSLAIAMALGLGVILTYSVAGGMVAGVYTDLFQGALMVVAAGGVFFYAMEAGGGLGSIAETIAGSDQFGPEFLDPLGGVPIFTALGFFFVFGLGNLGQPHMLHKFYMLDDPRKLKWFPLLLGLTQSACVLIWLGIGLAVPALVVGGRLAPLERPDDAAPTFLLNFVPEMLAGLVFAGVLAAIMSSADSFVNIASAAWVRDLPRALGRPVAQRACLGTPGHDRYGGSRCSSGLFYGDLIALLGTFAFGTFGAALGPALAIGLNWKRVTAGAASASILTGMSLNIGLELLKRQTIFPSLPDLPFASGVLPTAVSLAASITVLMVVSWWQGTENGEVQDPAVRVVMEL